MADPFDVGLPQVQAPPIGADIVEIKNYRVAKARDGSDCEVLESKFTIPLASLIAQKVSLEAELAKITKQIDLANIALGK